MNRALILVDLQNDFCPGGALAVPNGNQVIKVANRTAAAFDVVVATQDWHPANHGSFAANYEGKEPGQVVELAGLSQILWPTHCVQGTWGAQLVDELDQAAIEAIFVKGTAVDVDSYSGFYDNGGRHSTGLVEHLRAHDVDTIYVMGLATDYCVKATAIDGAREGFRVKLVEDGCRGVELAQGDIAAALQEMRAAGVEIVTSNSLR